MERILRKIRKNYFWIFLAIATFIYCYQRLGVSIPDWINNYMNDLLCLPIVLYICQAAVRYLRKDCNIVLPLPLILFMALGYSLYFEYFLPEINPRYTADAIDVALYGMGALFFYFMENLGNPFGIEESA